MDPFEGSATQDSSESPQKEAVMKQGSAETREEEHSDDLKPVTNVTMDTSHSDSMLINPEKSVSLLFSL